MTARPRRGRRALVVTTATVAAAAVAGAVALQRATHPKGARGSGLPDPGRGRAPLPDALFDMPADVVHHELPTPDGGVVHAVERGSGRPLVLLHGVTLRHDVWAPQFNELADRFRVIAVDLRGHGTSKAGASGYGMTLLGEDLATLLESLDLRHALVVGHSMGGMTVMQFCGLHPDVLAERVDGLIFLATRAHQVLPPALVGVARAVMADGQRRLDAGRDLPARTRIDPRSVRFAFGERPSPRAVRTVAEMGGTMEPAALVGSITGLLEHDAREALRATKTPSLVVVGSRDLLTPVPAASHLAALLPDCELVVLPRAGHQLMQERPAELAALIDELAARTSPPEGTL